MTEKKQYLPSTSLVEEYNFENLKKSILLPQGEDLNEWLAINTVDFYNQINMIYGSLLEFCTEETCPQMGCGKNINYIWAQTENGKTKTYKLSARKYIHKLMDWIEQLLDNPSIFPVSKEDNFPTNFQSIIKKIFTRLFRVYAHVYTNHFKKIEMLGTVAQINLSFIHFSLFIKEFDLVNKEELLPLNDFLQLIYLKLQKKSPSKLIDTTQAVSIYLYSDRNNYHKFHPDYSSQYFGKSERISGYNALTIKLHLTPSCMEGFLEQEGVVDGILGRSINVISRPLDWKPTTETNNLLLPQFPAEDLNKTSIENEKEKEPDHKNENQTFPNLEKEQKMGSQFLTPTTTISNEHKETKNSFNSLTTNNEVNKQNNDLVVPIQNNNQRIIKKQEIQEIVGMVESEEDNESEEDGSCMYLRSLSTSIKNNEEPEPLGEQQIRSRIERYFLRGNLLNSRYEFDSKVDNQINTQWKPPGKSILTYKLPLLQENNPLSNLQFEVFSGNFQDNVFKKYFHSIEHILVWFNSQVKFLDLKDNSWTIYLLFEKTAHKNERNKATKRGKKNKKRKEEKGEEKEKECYEKEGHEGDSKIIYTLAGIATSYRYFKYPDSFRLRLNNFIVLPPYRSRQNKFNFLTAIYLDPLKDPKVKEITSEINSPAFSSIRTQLDLLICWDYGFFSKLKINSQDLIIPQLLETYFRERKLLFKKNEGEIGIENDNEQENEIDKINNFSNKEEENKKKNSDKIISEGKEAKNKENENRNTQEKNGKENNNKENEKRKENEENEGKGKEDRKDDENKMEVESDSEKNISLFDSTIQKKTENNEEIQAENQKFTLSKNKLSKITKETKLHKNQIIKCHQISLFNKIKYEKDESLIKKFRLQVKKRLSLENTHYLSNILHRKEWLEDKYLQEMKEFQNILSRIQKN
ncbi:mob kinase activator-like [Anaeramoeba flamelloides]|uniref:Mob kinase activator-like n=1 Tax=Anaeramoeba flamelloides TaxID=1746091 RepID=A0AAV7Z1E3_9EUKA|nr:mob kinase activator-like [Anaeramoeba flamelloides]